MVSQVKIKILSLGIIAVLCAIFFLMGGIQNNQGGFQLPSSKRDFLQDIFDIPKPLRMNMSFHAIRETYVRLALQQRDYYYDKLRRTENKPNNRAGSSLNKAFEEDPNQIGELSREDYKFLAQRAFDIVDLDQDGTISKQEHQVFQQTRFDLPQSCKLAYPHKEVGLVSIGIHEGMAISSATASGQDRVNTAVTILVEDSADPLSVVLISSAPVIWQFKGNTSAIHQVILNGFNKNGTYQSANGVNGVSKDYIHFLNPKCISPYSHPLTWRGLLAKSSIKQIVGRSPDIMIGEFEVNSISISLNGLTIVSEKKQLPALNLQAPTGFDQDLWSVFLRYYPAGITDINPNTVVSTEHVEKYIILPKVAGLAQLVFEELVIPIPGAMKIVKDIPRYPAELGGINFILARGVSIPKGQAGMACVWREGSWGLLYNSGNGRCRVATDLKRLAY